MTPGRRSILGAGVPFAVGLVASAIATAASTTVPAQPPAEVGNAACRPCHRQIYDTYVRTPMARTSGPARAGLIEGAFTHARSGIPAMMVDVDGG